MANINTSLQRKLHSALKVDDLWVQFMEAIATEMELQKTEDDTSRYINDIYHNLEDGVIRICNKFGYVPNLVIDNSLEYIIKEAESIPYRIRNKSTYNGYLYGIRSLGLKGDAYGLYYDGYKLIKTILWSSTYFNLNGGIYISLQNSNLNQNPSSAPSYWQLLNSWQLTTTYTINQYVTYNDSIYISLQNSNIGKTPSTSPTYWSPVVATASPWSSSHTYALGDFTSYNSVSNYTQPFTGLSSDKNFSIISSSRVVYLDDGRTLDENPSWFLDSNKYVLPSKHLVIEFLLDRIHTQNSIDYLIYEDYLTFLEVEVEYNRRIPVTPHIGGQLALIVDQSGVFDSFSPGASYSIPTTKVNSAVTFNYIQQNNTLPGGVGANNIVYLGVGTGTRSLLNQANQNLYLYTSLILAYTLDQSIPTQVFDISSNINPGIISGLAIMVPGIIGKTIGFNGTVTIASTNPVSIVSSLNLTFQFWLKINSGQVTPTIFKLGNIKAEYIQSTGSFKLTVGTTSQTYAISENLSYLVQIEVNQTASTFTLYLNGIAVSPSAVTYSGSVTNGNLYLGYDGTGNQFSGLVDQFYILNRFFSPTEKTYIQTNSLAIINNLRNPLYFSRIEAGEVSSQAGYWLGVQSYAPANSRNQEFMFATQSGITTYLHTSDFPNLLPYFVKISYTFNDGFSIIPRTVFDDGSGGWDDNNLSGSVNYTTGLITINTFKVKTQLQKNLASTPVSSIHTFLDPNIGINTFKIYYRISSTDYVGIDNGLGVVSGTGISSGTLNYTTGELTITFTSSTDTGTFVYSQYQYTTNLGTNVGTQFSVEYKTSTPIEITEAGIYDGNQQLLAYTTFPRCRFKDIFDHLSLAFLIKKF